MDILSRNWMLQSERELAQEFGRKNSRPNMRWNEFRNLINRQDIRKNCLISSEALYTELKWGGAKDGKMDGYKVPKEEKLSKLLFILGYKEEPVKQKVKVDPEYDSELAEALNEEKPIESEAAKEICEIKNPLAVCLLKFYCQQAWKVCSSKFWKKYRIDKKKVQAASEYLVNEGIFETNGVNGRGRVYRWAIPVYDLLEFYPWIKQQISDEELTLAGIKIEKTPIREPWESVMIPSVENFLDGLTESHPYSLQELASTFNLDSHNAICLQNHLLAIGILAETRNGITPTYSWQKPSTTESDYVIPPNGKDLVIEGSRVRIINESDKEIKLLVKDNEIILKV